MLTSGLWFSELLVGAEKEKLYTPLPFQLDPRGR